MIPDWLLLVVWLCVFVAIGVCIVLTIIDRKKEGK